MNFFRFLFCLPNSVEQSAKKEDYDIVLNDYVRAKNLFGKTEISVFKKVLHEVDLRIVEIRKQLYEKLKCMPQNVDQQRKFIKSLINLETQQAHLQLLDRNKIPDPAWEAIESRAHYLEATLKQTFDQYSTKDMSSDRGKNSKDINQPPNRVLFCEEISEIAANQLPDLWRLGQAYFTGELRAFNDIKPGNFKRIILTSIEHFCNYLRVALLPTMKNLNTISGISWPNNQQNLNQFHIWLPHCLRYVRISYATLIRLDLPNEALDVIQKLIDDIRLYCLSTIFKKSIEKVKALVDRESWEMTVIDFPGATNMVYAATLIKSCKKQEVLIC